MADPKDRYFRIRIEINRRQLAWGLSALIVAGFAFNLMADTMTMTTYYPSPTGIYQRLTTTARTILARDTGDVIMAQGGGKVGIGTTTAPQAKLDLSGTPGAFLPPLVTTVQRDAIVAPGTSKPTAGSVVYNTDAKALEYYDGTAWKSALGAQSGGLYGLCTHTIAVYHDPSGMDPGGWTPGSCSAVPPAICNSVGQPWQPDYRCVCPSEYALTPIPPTSLNPGSGVFVCRKA